MMRHTRLRQQYSTLQVMRTCVFFDRDHQSNMNMQMNTQISKCTVQVQVYTRACVRVCSLIGSTSPKCIHKSASVQCKYKFTVRTIYHAAKILFSGGAASSHPLKYIES
jgi:hypothetical protein